MRLYDLSLTLAIMTEYPEYAWLPWKFNKSLTGWWRDLQKKFKAGNPIAEAVVRLYMEDLAQQNNVETLDDWYLLSHMQLGGGTWVRISNYLSGLPNILVWLYPHHNWNLHRFATSGKRSIQNHVVKLLQRYVFPHEGIFFFLKS